MLFYLVYLYSYLGLGLKRCTKVVVVVSFNCLFKFLVVADVTCYCVDLIFDQVNSYGVAFKFFLI